MLTGAAGVNFDQLEAASAIDAIEAVAPNVMANTTGAKASDGTAVIADGEGATSLIPMDATDGIQMKVPDGSDVVVGLPFASTADEAVHSNKAGVVVYDNNNGSSTVPVARRDGSLQISTVITSSEAPRRYDYSLTLPANAQLELTSDGGARADGKGEAAATVNVAPPWAMDANGNAVPTHYEVRNDVLTQVVEFDAETAFPVVADPTIAVDYYTYKVTNVKTTGTVARWKKLNSCTAAANRTCSVSRSYTVSADVQLSLGVPMKTVSASIGFSTSTSSTMNVSCGVTGPGTAVLYAKAWKKTYKVVRTHHKGTITDWSNNVKKTNTTSGTLTAYNPNGAYTCD